MKRGRSDMFEVGCSFAPVASIDDEEGGGRETEDGGFKALPDIDRVTCTSRGLNWYRSAAVAAGRKSEAVKSSSKED